MSSSFSRFLESQLSRPAPRNAAWPRRPVYTIAGDDSLHRAADAIRQFPLIGLDVETSFGGALATIQVATSAATAVIDVLAVSSLEALRPLFESPSILKVIHCAGVERGALGRRGLTIRSIFDTHIASRRKHGPRPQGGHNLGAVVRRELGLVLDKRQRFSNWMNRPLSPEQIRYAALDAEVLVDLHRVFHNDGH